MSAPLRPALSIIAEVLQSEAQARKVLVALRQNGFACVPREPTEEMLEEGWYYAHEEDAKGTWRAMIDVGDK